MEGGTLSNTDRRTSGGVIAGPAVGMTGRGPTLDYSWRWRRCPRRGYVADSAAVPPAGLQMSYATGRSSRSADKLPPPVTGSPINTNSPAYAPGTPAGTRQEAAAERPAESAVQLQHRTVEEDEELLPEPPQPPIIFPSSAAAVRVKEHQLAASGGASGNWHYSSAQEEAEQGNLDDAADAAVAADQQQGPGLLQRAVDVTSSAAQYAADLAAGAYAAAVGQGEGAETQVPKEAGGVGEARTAAMAPAGPVGLPAAAATLAPAERSAAAATTAVLSASAAAPSVIEKVNVPVAGPTVAAVKPGPTVSGAPGAEAVSAGLLGQACAAKQDGLPVIACSGTYHSNLLIYPKPSCLSLLQAARRRAMSWLSA